jgi:hypothetical protein
MSNSSIDETSSRCRMSNFGPMNNQLFEYFSCMECYKNLQYVFSNDTFKPFISWSNDWANYIFNNTIHFDTYTLTNEKITMLKNTMPSYVFDKWQMCCDEAKKCCNQMNSATLSPILNGSNNDF